MRRRETAQYDRIPAPGLRAAMVDELRRVAAECLEAIRTMYPDAQPRPPCRQEQLLIDGQPVECLALELPPLGAGWQRFDLSPADRVRVEADDSITVIWADPEEPIHYIDDVFQL